MVSTSIPRDEDFLMDNVEGPDRSARLLAVAHAVKATVEPFDVILREATTHS